MNQKQFYTEALKYTSQYCGLNEKWNCVYNKVTNNIKQIQTFLYYTQGSALNVYVLLYTNI